MGNTFKFEAKLWLKNIFSDLWALLEIFSLLFKFTKPLVVILKHLNRLIFSKLNYLEQGKEESKNIDMCANKYFWIDKKSATK